MLSAVATIEVLDTKGRSQLTARYLIGRARTCNLLINRPKVSGVHAEIIWTGGAWQIRDLGSRNGTYVDGRKISVQEHAPLVAGTEVAIGEPRPSFRLIDDAPPRLLAVNDSGDLVVGEDDMLLLTAEPGHEVSVFRGADGQWRLETANQTRDIEDQHSVVVGEVPWRIHLPSSVNRTQDAKTSAEPALSEVGLEFFVSRDGEFVSVTIVKPDGKIELEPRAHAQLLLVLGRSRLADVKQGHLSDSECGWLHREDLARMLATDPQLVNLWVFRARQQLSAAGIRGAAGVVERRAGAQQLRLGICEIRIHDA